MQKSLYILLSLFTAFSVLAGEEVKGVFAPFFNLYVNAPLTEQDAIGLSTGKVPRCPVFQVRPDKNHTVNISKSGGGKRPQRTPALLEAVLTADKAGKIHIGAGADWWFECFVNGQCVFKTTANGNNMSPVRIDNFIFEIPVRKGANKIVLLVHSGSGGWKAALGIPDEATKKAYRQDQYPRRNPYLTHAAPGKVTLNFFTPAPAVAFADCRVRGTGKWRRVYELFGGQARNDRTKHTIELSGLKPDTDYEYRTGRWNDPAGKDVTFSPVYTFRSFTDKAVDFSVFYLSDTQFFARKRIQLLKKYLDNCKAAEADFLIHGGDISDQFDEAETHFMDSFINVLTAKRNQSKPFVILRGNHEYRGTESSKFIRFFGGCEEKSYFMFRQGNTCFIVLDTGEDHPRQPNPLYARTFSDELLKEQRNWLAKAVEQPMFRKATFRVVLTHSPGNQPFMEERIRKMTDGILSGNKVSAPIHLWLCAHTHRYSRSIKRGSNAVRAVSARSAIRVSPAFQNSILLINDGPGHGDNSDASCMLLLFRKDEIEIRAMTPDGKVFDHFSIYPDGTLKEHSSSLALIE